MQLQVEWRTYESCTRHLFGCTPVLTRRGFRPKQRVTSVQNITRFSREFHAPSKQTLSEILPMFESPVSCSVLCVVGQWGAYLKLSGCFRRNPKSLGIFMYVHFWLSPEAPQRPHDHSRHTGYSLGTRF